MDFLNLSPSPHESGPLNLFIFLPCEDYLSEILPLCSFGSHKMKIDFKAQSENKNNANIINKLTLVINVNMSCTVQKNEYSSLINSCAKTHWTVTQTKKKLLTFTWKPTTPYKI